MNHCAVGQLFFGNTGLFTSTLLSVEVLWCCHSASTSRNKNVGKTRRKTTVHDFLFVVLFKLMTTLFSHCAFLLFWPIDSLYELGTRISGSISDNLGIVVSLYRGVAGQKALTDESSLRVDVVKVHNCWKLKYHMLWKITEQWMSLMNKKLSGLLRSVTTCYFIQW